MVEAENVCLEVEVFGGATVGSLEVELFVIEADFFAHLSSAVNYDLVKVLEVSEGLLDYFHTVVGHHFDDISLSEAVVTWRHCINFFSEETNANFNSLLSKNCPSSILLF